MFPNPPGLLRLEPHSEGLRDRIWWGSATDATAVWAASVGMNFQGGPLKIDETGEPFHVQQARSIRQFRQRWAEAGHDREPRVAVARTIFPLISAQDHAFFGRQARPDSIVAIAKGVRGVFGRTYAAAPNVLVKELADDEALAEADTVLLTIPDQMGVEYNAKLISSVLSEVGPSLAWR